MDTPSPLDSCYANDPRVIALIDAIVDSGKDVEDSTSETVNIPGPPYEYMQSYFVQEMQDILAREGWNRKGHRGCLQWVFVKSLPGAEDMECQVAGAENSEERFTLTFLLVE